AHRHAAWRLRYRALRPPWTAPARLPSAQAARIAAQGGRASAPRPAAARRPARGGPWRRGRTRCGSSWLLRRCRQLAGAERAVAVDVLLVERGGDAGAVAFARHRLALAAGQFVGRERTVAVAVHRVEGVAHPVLVLDQRNAAVTVAIHAREVVAGGLHLRVRGGRRRREQEEGGQGLHAAHCKAARTARLDPRKRGRANEN